MLDSVAQEQRVSKLDVQSELYRNQYLINAIVNKNRDALSELYRRTVSKLYAISYSVLSSQQDAEEIVCDVFMYVWQNAHVYDRRRAHVLGWLTVITRHRAIDRFRRRLTSPPVDDYQGVERPLVSGLKSPEAFLAQFQDRSAVRCALARLSPLRRKLIGLAFFQGLTHEEMALTLGLPAGTVKSHIRRAIMILRGALHRDAISYLR